MLQRHWIPVSLLAWGCVGSFWLTATYRFHPTFLLAMIVTSALVVAYATAIYINHLVLIPKFARIGQTTLYAASLLAVMVTLTGLALVIIRTSYFNALGPDPDPYGTYKHFLIDLVGMAIHLAAAWVVVRVSNRISNGV